MTMGRATSSHRYATGEGEPRGKGAADERSWAWLGGQRVTVARAAIRGRWGSLPGGHANMATSGEETADAAGGMARFDRARGGGGHRLQPRKKSDVGPYQAMRAAQQ